MKRPLFITIEGGEGAGKSTLIRLLSNYLESHGESLILTREPGGSLLGDQVRILLLNTEMALHPRSELFLILAARVQHLDECIRPALAKKKIVLCDRFNDSTIAYQGGGRNLGVESVEQSCHLACEGLDPDLTFLLDIDPIVGFGRLKGRALDRLEKENLAFHTRVRETFLHIAKNEPKRVFVLDASLSQKELFEQAKIILKSKYELSRP